MSKYKSKWEKITKLYFVFILLFVEPLDIKGNRLAVKYIAYALIIWMNGRLGDIGMTLTSLDN